MNIRIGTRSSKLALWQANFVSDELTKNGFSTEIIHIETKGDKILNKSLSKIGSKGVFTEELETQLRNKTIDIAVHSAKDVQSRLDEDLEIIAFTKRERTNDVLLSLNPNLDLRDSPTIGTSSTRRRAQLKHLYPNIDLVEMRGNLQTRLEKLKNGDADGIILAWAGVHRMHMEQYIVHEFPLSELTPAAGQGSVAIQCSNNLHSKVREHIVECLNHTETYARVSCERSFLKEMEGGCSIPIFSLATIDGNQINISGGIINLDGKKIIKSTKSGSISDYDKIGKELAVDIISQGGKIMLDEIQNKLNNE